MGLALLPVLLVPAGPPPAPLPAPLQGSKKHKSPAPAPPPTCPSIRLRQVGQLESSKSGMYTLAPLRAVECKREGD